MMKVGEPRPEQAGAIEAIVRELKNLDEKAFPALHALAENELFRLRGGIAESIDIVSNRQVKIRAKIEIPSSQYPGVNFVGKLLGPGGQTLRATQESTKTKMAILGAGSLRDDSKERELLSSGDPKYQHLKQKLHLQVDSLAPPSEAYYRLSHALAELRKVMLPSAPAVGSLGYPLTGDSKKPCNLVDLISTSLYVDLDCAVLYTIIWLRSFSDI
ncbi:KH domain-containing RNA-binding signal transduction-associated protein 2 [Clonorchis sinensis]|uniref:KH domain-containing RNA-binding signal transduction-associated protein 2 n=1 Tax=Clonorchis sinensis TaxID=79923 RepID=G7YKR5_CLOSI|nr:KH domain-containing RNA-binding signal transduction-associated protein 2 [Clonorchis sinensis]